MERGLYLPTLSSERALVPLWCFFSFLTKVGELDKWDGNRQVCGSNVNSFSVARQGYIEQYNTFNVVFISLLLSKTYIYHLVLKARISDY